LAGGKGGWPKKNGCGQVVMLNATELLYCGAAVTLLLYMLAVYGVLTNKLGIARVSVMNVSDFSSLP
jgi:hypothetical protein